MEPYDHPPCLGASGADDPATAAAPDHSQMIGAALTRAAANLMLVTEAAGRAGMESFLDAASFRWWQDRQGFRLRTIDAHRRTR